MLDKLPLVPLVRVFSYIDDFSDKIALERVCKQWRPLIWEKTKTCPVPMNDMEALGLVLNRCGDQLEELWLQSRLKWPQNVWQIDEKLINQMGRRMNSLKHLKISNCRLDGPAVNSIADLFGQQLYSFILDNTPYHPNMRRLIENESSKLEHLQIDLTPDYSTGTLPTKLLNNLKSFSLRTLSYDLDSSLLLLNIARDCKNLKILHLQIDTLFLPNMIWAIGNIKSLVYLNLDTNSIQNEAALINVICHELPNLKALHIGGYYSKKIVSNICRDRPDLVHLNVFTRHPFQISDSLNSLTLRISMLNKTADLRQFLPSMLFNQSNKSIQHLDIRSLRFPSSSNFIKKLLGQFPDLKSIHWKMPMDAANANLTSFFALIEKHLENGRKIKIYFHHDCPRPQYYPQYCKYILPDDLAQFEAGWRPKLCNGKCENLVLKKLIKEAVDGGNEPSFLDDLWME